MIFFSIFAPAHWNNKIPHKSTGLYDKTRLRVAHIPSVLFVTWFFNKQRWVKSTRVLSISEISSPAIFEHLFATRWCQSRLLMPRYFALKINANHTLDSSGYPQCSRWFIISIWMPLLYCPGYNLLYMHAMMLILGALKFVTNLFKIPHNDHN